MGDEVKRLYRSKKERMIEGVAGGVAEYFGADPTLVRVVFVVLALSSFGSAILLYLAATIIIPEAPDEKTEDAKEESSKLPRTKRVSETHGREILAIGLIAVGLASLLNHLFSFRWWRFDLFFPFVLIILGIYFLVGKKE